MLMRILEPEVMDTVEDAEEYDAMDFSGPNTLFAEDALELVKPLGARPLRVLDIGTGTAQIPLLMLARRPDLEVTAVDLAREMLRVAARNVAAAGLSEACRLAVMDAKALRFNAARFDLVMCNSTAHHIPEPAQLFKEIARVTRPDGAIIVRDLLRPDSMDDAWSIVKRVAAGEHPRQQQLFFDSLCAALTLDEVSVLARQTGLGKLRVARVSDRHWTAERRASPSRAS
jgi:ubiquinone/menaquinone biosynthesis C-methylase UbiE